MPRTPIIGTRHGAEQVARADQTGAENMNEQEQTGADIGQASPMVADPYATPRPMVRRTTTPDGTIVATVRNNATRRRMTDRLTDRDRDGIVRAAVMMGTFVGHDHPADDWAPWRRATVRNVHTIGTTAHLRPSELAWIDAVPHRRIPRQLLKRSYHHYEHDHHRPPDRHRPTVYPL